MTLAFMYIATVPPTKVASNKLDLSQMLVVVDDLGNLRVIINARDITERKRAEEKISSLNRDLADNVAELRL